MYSSMVRKLPRKKETGPTEKKRPFLKTLKICAMTAISFVIGVTLLVAFTRNAAAAPTTDAIQSFLKGDSQSLQIIIMLTLITLVPTLLIMMTGFTRIVIVLSIVRNAIGLQNMPPNTVIIGLALFITYFVMTPTINQVKTVSYDPYVAGDIKLDEAATKAMVPIRDFMLKQTYQTDLRFFADLSGIKQVDDVSKIPDRVVIAAFVTSELKHAFAIGFFIYIPFVVIDMVVASTLMAMGMMMLPPAMISMPFKILLFVLVDGWQLTIGTIVKSFSG